MTDDFFLEDRWSEVESLFQKAIDLPRDEIEDFIQQACGDDEALRQLLSQLVEADLDDGRIRNSVMALSEGLGQEICLIGKRIGAYRVDSLIGAGGMGEVYNASRADGQFQKRVAIKVVQQQLNQDQFLDHFQTELQALATLQHPFIPTLLDSGQLEDGRLYFVAEFVDGIRIDHFCERHSFSTHRKILLFEKLCDAVRHAHSNLILHLDIKPANVLVEASGNPCLLDFGITRLMSDPERGLRAFTADYASPEQIAGQPPTAASDVYSLGVLLYQLLTRQKPFGDSELDTVPMETRLAAREALASESTLSAAPGVDDDLLAILQKALAFSVMDRYRTVESLLADLRRYRNHLPVRARKRTAAYVATKYLRRNAVGLSISGSVIFLLLAFGTREIQLRSAAQTARDEAQAAYAQAELEAETLRQVSDFLVGLFRVSNPGEARGNSVTARELLDRGASRIESSLGDRPAVRTRMMRTMADVYSSLGLYNAAAELDEQALDASLAAFGSHHPDVADTLSALGSLYRLQARYADSEQAHRRALAIRESMYGSNDPSVAESLNGLAQAQWYLGESEAAESNYRRALQIREDAFGGEAVEVANSLVHLGWLLEREERFDEAYELLSRSLEIRDRELGDDHFLVAENLDLLAQINVARQSFTDAETQLSRALTIRRRVLESNHPDIGMSLLSLGRLYRAQGRYEDALEFLKQAESHFSNALGADHYQVAATLEDLGLVLAGMQDWASAETAYRRQLAILERTVTHEHLLVGAALNNLGWVLSDGLRDYDEGEAVLKRAVALFDQAERRDDYWRALSRWSLANNLRDQGRFSAADPYYLQAKAILEQTGGSERADNPSLDDLLKDYALMLEAKRR
ncbi:MAG: serine/threonine-protein kinase [Pseudomonadota bacterium]